MTGEVTDKAHSSSSMPNTRSDTSTLLRGALKIETSTATSIVAAGSEFSIYVVIRNPFPVPVVIEKTETHIPIELSDETRKKADQKLEEKKRIKGLADEKRYFQRLLLRASFWFSDLYKWIRPDSGSRVATAVSTEQDVGASRPPADLTIYGDLNSQGDVNLAIGDKWDLKFDGGMSDEQIRKILWDIHEYARGSKPITLRSGDSIVQHFVLKTTRWLTFTPIAHTFQIQVYYEVDGQKHVDTVPFSLNIRAATASCLIGAVIGSMLGAIVTPKADLSNWTKISRTLLTSSIFAIIIVVAFARKNNVQQIVSVEDFWGGMFIGFLVGYSGETFIASVLGQPNTGTG